MDSISKMPAEDGAAEKLVGESKSDYSLKEQKPNTKLIIDSQNGDTKIDIDNLRSAFVGMGKEELMKYANDPFWIRMRLFLFVLFWFLWFAMLSGAIAIIVLAPKCAAPVPREWYEQSPIYKIDIRSVGGNHPEENSLKGLEEKIAYFKDLGVDSILVDSLMKTTDGDPNNIEDFQEVDPKLGTRSELKELANRLKEKGLHLLMSFIPNFSSDKHNWFIKSVAKEEPFKDYYVWAPSKGTHSDGQRIQPNNWVSVTGGSAWEWNEDRGEFYLHQFNKSQPDLNFHNRELVEYFKGVFKFWLDLGISGFYLKEVEYLLEDENLKNESINNLARGATHDQYDFYSHRYSKHLPGTFQLMREWTGYIKNQSGVILFTDMFRDDSEHIEQLTWQTLQISSSLNAESLEEMIGKRINTSSTVWEWSCKDPTDCIDENFGKSLQMSMLLLPGTTVIRGGEELDANGNESNITEIERRMNSSLHKENDEVESSFTSYKALIEVRHSPSVMYGATEMKILNSTVFVYSRIKSGNPGYLVAFNLGDEDVVINFQELKAVPKEVAVVVRSTDFGKNIVPKNKISSSEVLIRSKGTLVVTFVPDTESQ